MKKAWILSGVLMAVTGCVRGRIIKCEPAMVAEVGGCNSAGQCGASIATESGLVTHRLYFPVKGNAMFVALWANGEREIREQCQVGGR